MAKRYSANRRVHPSTTRGQSFQQLLLGWINYLYSSLDQKKTFLTQVAFPPKLRNLPRWFLAIQSHAIQGAHVTSLALGFQVLTNTRARMHGDRLADDQTVLDQLPPQAANLREGTLNPEKGRRRTKVLSIFLRYLKSIIKWNISCPTSTLDEPSVVMSAPKPKWTF